MQDLGSPEKRSSVPETSVASGVEVRQITTTDLHYLCWAAFHWCEEHNRPDEQHYRGRINAALKPFGWDV